MEVTTIIIALIVAYIGYLQYRINRERKEVEEEKLKLDLFDKRFKVFEATRDLFQEILKNGNADSQETHKFRLLTMDAIFLFDDEIHDYLETKVHMMAIKVSTIVREYEPLPKGKKKTALLKEQTKVVDWFRNEYFELQNLFSPYLKFRVWKEN